MASKSAGAAPNPFASAKSKGAGTASSPKASNVIPAQDFESYDGGKYTKAQVAEAIESYVDGKEKYDSGETMMKANRPTVMALARTFFAKDWLMRGARPKSPLIAVDPSGRGASMKSIFTDSKAKLNEESYAALANLIGAAKAEQVTRKADEFHINPELLDQTVAVKKDGKVVQQNVMMAIAEALQDRFAPSPEIVANLFQVVHIFETQKGLIEKGLELCCPDKSPASAIKLAQFLEVGRFVTQLRPSGGGDE